MKIRFWLTVISAFQNFASWFFILNKLVGSKWQHCGWRSTKGWLRGMLSWQTFDLSCSVCLREMLCVSSLITSLFATTLMKRVVTLAQLDTKRLLESSGTLFFLIPFTAVFNCFIGGWMCRLYWKMATVCPYVIIRGLTHVISSLQVFMCRFMWRRGLRVSMFYVVYVCGGVLFISLYLRMRSLESLKAHSIVNHEQLWDCEEPKPSIRAGHIPYMQTNELEH